MLNSGQLHLFRVLSKNQRYWVKESIRRARFSVVGAEDDSCNPKDLRCSKSPKFSAEPQADASSSSSDLWSQTAMLQVAGRAVGFHSDFQAGMQTEQHICPKKEKCKGTP